MPEETLEQVRLLSNLESSRHKLLQIVLFGQPELDSVLDKPSMRQLKDRITHSFRMRPLSEDEIGKYLTFRMRAAGYRGPDVFSPRAVAMIAKAASGLTRRVNILADKALLAAFTESKHAIGARQARLAIRDSEFGRLLAEKRSGPLVFGATALAAGLALGASLHWILAGPPEQPKIETPRAMSGGAAATPREPSPATLPVVSGAVATISSVPPSAPLSTTVPPAGSPSLTLGTVVPIPEPSIAKPQPAPEAEETTRLSTDAAKRIASFRVGANSLLKARIEATRERLEREPDGSYSIELFATDNDDPARMERFLTRARELVPLDNILVMPQANSGRNRIRVTFGGYPDRSSALQAAERLPPKYKQAFQPELRTFAELRKAL
jgi:septal ring-binding cell division protein DamX